VDSSPPRHGSVVHSRDARLWIQPVIPVEERGVAVEDAPERGVCERNVPVAPCGVGVSGHRTSPTHSPRGMRDQPETTIRTTTERLAGRRWRRPGDGACGIATSRPDRPGASPVPVTGVTKDHGLVRGTTPHLEGPLSLIPTRALLLFPFRLVVRLVQTTRQQHGREAVDEPEFLVDDLPRAVDGPEEIGLRRDSVPETPCGGGVAGRRTSPTQSLRGPRDRSETTICTTTERLAGRGWRWPDDGAAGIVGAGWIDRRHRYRSKRWTAGPRPRVEARRTPTEGPLSLIPTGALQLFPGGHDASRSSWHIQSHLHDVLGHAGCR
jgi:hypothetical protein